MIAQQRDSQKVSLLEMEIVQEQDVVVSRHRARELASLLGFSGPDQVRIATSVSEIARNVHQYGQAGFLDFSLELNSRPQVLWMSIASKGRGVGDLLAIPEGHAGPEAGLRIGINGIRRLMDLFEILTDPSQKTVIRFGKRLPSNSSTFTRVNADEFHGVLAQQRPADPLKELQRQNRDLLQTLETLRLREIELETREEELSNLNVELHETNRGVVALYGELDEKALALQRADEMKSQFLWHVSHEFRTPLNAVRALTHLLLEHADGSLSAEQQKQVTYIRKAASDLTDMVNDLLDLAKVDSGKADMRWTSLDVSQLLGGIRGLMRPLADNDAVKLVFEELSQPISLISDESKVSQILRNLISNALKFTPAGSVNVAVRRTAGGESLVFVVRDTGIGIESGDLDRIFKEFEQVENPVQQHLKGTGLGLSLSRKLAALLGGTLEVTSSPGIGSTFSLTIPVQPKEDDSETNECDRKLSSRNAKTETILVIDDDEASRYLARRLFAGSRYCVIEAKNGIEGLQMAQETNPILILLDLVMPGRNGFEVLDDLKSNVATSHVPVVIHSSCEMDAESSHRLSNRILTILPKNRGSRRGPLSEIRNRLGEPALFSNEPEFLEN